MAKFSENLQDRLIDYFCQKYDFRISQDQAQEYLNSLADLALTVKPDNNCSVENQSNNKTSH